MNSDKFLAEHQRPRRRRRIDWTYWALYLALPVTLLVLLAVGWVAQAAEPGARTEPGHCYHYDHRQHQMLDWFGGHIFVEIPCPP